MTISRPAAGVAAGHSETADAAVQILRAGGNAFDAAIGGFLAACVAEPVLASLGGGGFLTARPHTGQIEVFDFFTQTPLSRPHRGKADFRPIIADFGAAQQEFHIGLGAAATPGAVAGIFDVHRALGRMPMADIIQPASRLARTGLRMKAFQAYILEVVGPIYTATPGAVKAYCRPLTGGEAPSLLREGDIYRATAFADVLEALVREGPGLFYQGDIAAWIADQEGCAIGRDDLAAYRVERRRPWTGKIRGTDLFLNPPPAIGGALIALGLALLDELAGVEMAFGDKEHLAAMARVMARCNEARAHSRIDDDPDAGGEALRRIAPHPPAYRGTTHISVADKDGNLAAVTVSNGEGCGHIIPGTGIMLNNMLGEDDLNAAGFFNWPEGVRLSSMMAPGLVKTPDGAWVALGSGGSNRIRSALMQVIANMALFGDEPERAVTRPRLHLEADKLSIEPGFSDAALDVAARHAETLQLWPAPNMFFGGAHAVRLHADGQVDGVGDPRRDGVFVAI